MKLIDADKLLEYLNGSPEGYISDVCYEGLKERINSGTFSPTPPVQPDTPDIKIDDLVTHSEHPEYGEGKVRTYKNALNEVYVKFARTQAHFSLDKLEVITDDTTP